MQTETQVNRELAVAIAKDVLKQIGREDVPLPIGEQSGYLSGRIPGVPEDGVFQEYADVIQANCKVCMLGGLFLSKARIAPSVPLSVMSMYEGDVKMMGHYQVVGQLSDAFTPADLDLIESAFEVINSAEHLFDDYAMQERHEAKCASASRWGNSISRYQDKTGRIARARAICENIIANGGRFVVPARD